MDLVQWLRDQLDEDERIAREAIRAVGDVPGGVPGAADWRFGDGSSDEAGGYWHITTTPPDGDVFGVVELVGSGMQGGGAHEPEFARHIARHDPARVLREIDASRELLSRYEAMAADVLVMTGVESILAEYRRVILPTLAQRYADRPGYAEALASLA